MLDKASTSPQQRLLSLFDLLADWLHAPHIQENLRQSSFVEQAPGALLQYLAAQSRLLQAQAPEALAHQFYFMALRALQQELHTPGCGALIHARQAAQALLDAQCAKENGTSRFTYGLAASVIVTAGFVSFMMLNMMPYNAQPPLHASQLNKIQQPPVSTTAILNPAHTAEMYTSIEQMRNGVCRYPEALMLPEAQRSVYMRNVVGGEISSNATDQALASKLMQNVRCDYAPMLMKNSMG